MLVEKLKLRKKIKLQEPVYHIFNGLGAGNIGDELMMQGYWSEVNYSKSALVEVWDENSDIIKTFLPQHKYQSWLESPDKLKKQISNYKCAFLVGDTPVTETLGLDWPLKPLSQKLNLCHNCNLPVHAVGVGAEPLESAEALKIFETSYFPIKSWSVRSKRTFDILVKCGVKPDNIVLAADLAWLYRNKHKSLRNWAKKLWASYNIVFDRPLILFNVVNEKWQDKDSYNQKLANILDRLIVDLNVNIAFICNETRSGDFYDYEASKQVTALMENKAPIMQNDYFTPEQMIALLSFSTLTVGQRYHFAIESILADSVPLIFSRSSKLNELQDDLNLQSVGNMLNFDALMLFEQVKYSLQNREVILKNLKILKRKMYARAKQNFLFIKGF